MLVLLSQVTVAICITCKPLRSSHEKPLPPRRGVRIGTITTAFLHYTLPLIPTPNFTVRTAV